MAMILRLTVDVKCDAGDVKEADLARLLMEIIPEALKKGRFVSDLNASVTEAEVRVFVYESGLWSSVGVPLLVRAGDDE